MNVAVNEGSESVGAMVSPGSGVTGVIDGFMVGNLKTLNGVDVICSARFRPVSDKDNARLPIITAADRIAARNPKTTW